jgi:DNA-binding FrmR family transcriptional regulator
MTHTIRDRQKLLARVRRIRGQVEAIERALDSEAGCEQVMHLLAGARGPDHYRARLARFRGLSHLTVEVERV